ncbi:hypothetical protein J5N97_010660 [Dioscorea zingiberensis]|uniref:RING-type domain-containing protein n=1 Tax=Dioscorea zingiberensis TaxID=325984 RepID=A0A9D5D1N2_9LILI|nr:hypothetical protein J5N97_010660 [Dioscorea zingiberensis]
MHGGLLTRKVSDDNGASGMACSEEAAAAPQMVVRMKRELVAACLTCPLCHKLLRDATTISECLHTFCRKCILEKLNDEDSCPICNIDLGCVPVEKLRPDHNLQDVRAKIFPYKRRKVEAPEVVSSVSFPVKRKERSLSSLVVNTSKIGSQTGLTGRRTKTARKAAVLRGLNPVISVAIKKHTVSFVDRGENISSSKALSKMSSISRTSQDSANEDSSSNSLPIRDQDDNEESLSDNSEDPAIKEDQINSPDNAVHTQEGTVMDSPHGQEIQGDKHVTDSSTPVRARATRSRGTNQRRSEPEISAQALVDAAAAVRNERRITPMWFYLEASTDQGGNASLPQISPGHVRIKDVVRPVSVIQKYLAMKLNLANEAQVELMCHGQRLNPTMPMIDLVDIWPPAASSQRVRTTVGASGSEFEITLSYRRAPRY